MMSANDRSSNSSIFSRRERTGPLRTFGVSTNCEYVPAENINLINAIGNEHLCENMAFSQTLKASDDEIPEADVGEILHPVFSPMLHSSHRTAWHQTLEELSEILPGGDIGLPS